MANTLTVKSPSGQYNIQIEHGLLAKMTANPQDYGLDGHVIVATNRPLADLYGRDLAAALPNAGLIMMEDGEAHKNLDTVHRMYKQCIAAGSDRHTMLLAFGGGVVGDTMGFVAATYMRGIKLVQMPTSLLAMVDSSVGGKVGVDLPEGKNLVGAFKQPERVLIDPDVLKTLVPEEWRCGMGEILKHGLLADEKL
ncbi:MAG: 3-dehydroquinate synthase, partial [Aggregatilineales bacterium]